MGYLSRQPTSNDPPRSREGKSPWLGENDYLDKTALILAGLVEKCVKCERATHVRHLDSNQHCPDCR